LLLQLIPGQNALKPGQLLTGAVVEKRLRITVLLQYFCCHPHDSPRDSSALSNFPKTKHWRSTSPVLPSFHRRFICRWNRGSQPFSDHVPFSTSTDDRAPL